MHNEQYWADAATKNCVWLFQIREVKYGERGCTCGSYDDEGEEVEGHKCTCGIKSWRTENVFLTNEEANNYGKSRPYAWGAKNEGWRVYGVMCIGLMAEILGRSNNEFKDKVEYISPYKTFTVTACHDTIFHKIPCLENDEEYGFFKSEADVRPGHAKWIKKEAAERLYQLLHKGR